MITLVGTSKSELSIQQIAVDCYEISVRGKDKDVKTCYLKEDQIKRLASVLAMYLDI